MGAWYSVVIHLFIYEIKNSLGCLWYFKEEELEYVGIDPTAPRLRSECSTI